MDAELIDSTEQSVCCFFCSNVAKLNIGICWCYYDVCEQEVPETVKYGEIFALTEKQVVQIEKFNSF